MRAAVGQVEGLLEKRVRLEHEGEARGGDCGWLEGQRTCLEGFLVSDFVQGGGGPG